MGYCYQWRPAERKDEESCMHSIEVRPGRLSVYLGLVRFLKVPSILGMFGTQSPSEEVIFYKRKSKKIYQPAQLYRTKKFVH